MIDRTSQLGRGSDEGLAPYTTAAKTLAMEPTGHPTTTKKLG